MAKKNQSCPACNDTQLYYEDKFWNCKNCNYLFADKLSAESLNSYYQKDIGLRVQNILEDHQSKLRKYAELAYTYISKRERGLSVCDIGCGTGLFLVKVKKLGNKVYGYDINKSQTTLAKRVNKLSNVSYAQTLKEYCEKKNIKKNSFDVITCFEVIEHIPDVNKFLKEINTYLKPNGVLILSTPNNDRIQMKEKWDYPPIHVSRFKRFNMEKFFTKNGLQLQKYHTFNELGYYSGNYIAKLSFSQQMLESITDSSAKETDNPGKNTSTNLFKFLAKSKHAICYVLDIPVLVLLFPFKHKGHTMFLVANKIGK